MPPLLWKIVLGVALGLVIVRGGGPALVRLLLPVLIIYFGYKFIQRLAAAKLGEMAARMQEAARQAQDAAGHQTYDRGPTIEICPKCGHQKSPTSSCQCNGQNPS